MNLDDSIYVAGHNGLVGSAIVRGLYARGYKNLLLIPRSNLDLSNEIQTQYFFEKYQPKYVFLAAAKVGGIAANNSYSADFLLENLKIQNNVIKASFDFNVKKLIFFGSSCIYPKMSKQPIIEEALLSGPLEPTNRSYALAKIAGIELCWGLNRQSGNKALCLMPCNLYGVGDNYNIQTSHVIPALIKKFHTAKINGNQEVQLWGSGAPLREFLFSDDLAKAAICALEANWDEFFSLFSETTPPILNIGSSKEISIADLATLVAEVVGYTGSTLFDLNMPDGTPRKIMNSSKFHKLFDWKPGTILRDGLSLTYNDFLSRQ